MHRPINWIVVCISLLFLVANVSPPEHKAKLPAEPIVMSATVLPLSVSLIGEKPVEFGYVRDDGSFVPLPQPASSPGVEAGNAVLVWATPRITPPEMPTAF